MRTLLALLAITLCSGCSAVWKNTLFAPQPNQRSYPATAYDWETKAYAGVTFGRLRPDLFADEVSENFVIIYPALIESGGMMGPPIIPLGFSLEPGNGEAPYFAIRIATPEGIAPITPIELSLVKGNEKVDSCAFDAPQEDDAGPVFVCLGLGVMNMAEKATLEIKFSNGSNLRTKVAPVTVRGYSPLFSFNGPNPRPKLVVWKGEERHAFPG